MKKSIKFLIPFLGLLLFHETLSGQTTKEVIFNFDSYEYQIDGNLINVCLITVGNNSNDDLVLWFDKHSTDGMTNREKIQSYFFKFKGDFSFYNLLTERLIDESPQMVFGTFLKQVPKGEDFSIRVIGNDMDCNKLMEKCQEFVNQHLVLIKAQELLTVLKLNNSFFYWFDSQSIEIQFKYLP